MTDILGHEPLTFEQMKEIEQMYLQYEWETVKHQAAISAMQALIIKGSHTLAPNVAANDAVSFADALVKELQKNGKEKET